MAFLGAILDAVILSVTVSKGLINGDTFILMGDAAEVTSLIFTFCRVYYGILSATAAQARKRTGGLSRRLRSISIIGFFRHFCAFFLPRRPDGFHFFYWRLCRRHSSLHHAHTLFLLPRAGDGPFTAVAGPSRRFRPLVHCRRRHGRFAGLRRSRRVPFRLEDAPMPFISASLYADYRRQSIALFRRASRDR